MEKRGDEVVVGRQVVGLAIGVFGIAEILRNLEDEHEREVMTRRGVIRLSMSRTAALPVSSAATSRSPSSISWARTVCSSPELVPAVFPGPGMVRGLSRIRRATPRRPAGRARRGG